jgi:hypothetical protein
MNDHGYVPFVVVIVDPSIMSGMNDHGYVSFVLVIVEPSIMYP